MDVFPWYTTLSENIPKKDLTPTQKKSMIDDIITMNNQGHEIMFTLICMYNMNEELDEMSNIIPYNCASNTDKTYTWNVSDIPIKLRHLIFRFTQMHNKAYNIE